MKCTKCGEDKESEMFPFRNKEKGIRQTICKQCHRAYKLKYYYNNKQSHFDRNKLTHDKIKEYAISRKDKCIICGETERVCLDWHHVENKETEISFLYNSGSLKKMKEELQKCIVLCANCHRKLHYKLLKPHEQILVDHAVSKTVL